MPSDADRRGAAAAKPRAIRSPSRLGPLLVILVAVAVVAFGLGYRLGPGPPPQPTDGGIVGSPSPSPAASPVDLQQAEVGDRLERAYRSAGGGWQLCALDPTPACQPQNRQLSGPLADPALLTPSATRLDWEALGPRAVQGPDVALVADLGTDIAAAYVVGPLSEAESRPTKARVSTIAWHGAVYLGLRALRPGRYTVVVGGFASLAQGSAGPLRSPSDAVWWTYEAAFEVR